MSSANASQQSIVSMEDRTLKIYLRGRPIMLYGPSDFDMSNIEKPAKQPAETLELEWVYPWKNCGHYTFEFKMSFPWWSGKCSSCEYFAFNLFIFSFENHWWHWCRCCISTYTLEKTPLRFRSPAWIESVAQPVHSPVAYFLPTCTATLKLTLSVLGLSR